MKFTFAATVLAGALPLVEFGLASARSSSQEKPEFLLQGSDPTSAQRATHANLKQKIQNRRNRRRRRQLHKEKETVYEGDSSFLKKFHATKIECNPKISKHYQDVHADVGRLACSYGEYCMESSDSALGGLCVTDPNQMPPGMTPEMLQAERRQRRRRRKLEDPGYNDDDYYGGDFSYGTYICESYYYDCDCTQWNYENKTGDVFCAYVVETCNYDCEVETCYNETIAYSKGSEEDAIGIRQLCYVFSQPYNSTFCLDYSVPESGYISGACALSLDGETCTDCYVEPGTFCVDSNCTQLGVPAYECKDVEGYYYRDSDAYPVPPLLRNCTYEYVYSPSPTSGPITGECDLCPENTELLDDDAVGVFFPNIGTYSCEYLGSFADTGYLYGEACDYVKEAATETCCGAI